MRKTKEMLMLFFYHLIITMSKMFMYHRRPIYIYIIPDTTLSTVEEISSFSQESNPFIKKIRPINCMTALLYLSEQLAQMTGFNYLMVDVRF